LCKDNYKENVELLINNKCVNVISFDKNNAVIGLQNGIKGIMPVENTTWAIPELNSLKKDKPDYSKIVNSYNLSQFSKRKTSKSDRIIR
jgi:hypothetical protein